LSLFKLALAMCDATDGSIVTFSGEPSCPRQFKAPPRTVEQAYVKFVLEPADAMTHSALCRIQFGGSFGEAQMLSGDDKDPQRIERRSARHAFQRGSK
jgi:hypothetical protein